MERLVELFHQGGDIAYLAGVIGGVASLLALALLLATLGSTRSGVLRGMAIVALLLAAATAGAGIYGTVTARQQVDKVTASLKAGQAERIKRVGLTEAKACLTIALPLAVAPVLVAIIGLLA